MLFVVNFFPENKKREIVGFLKNLKDKEVKKIEDKEKGEFVGRIEWNKKKVIVKVHRRARILHFLLSPFGASKGKRCYEMAVFFRKRKFPVPEPFFAWEKRKFGFVLETGYVEEFCEGIRLREFLAEKFSREKFLKKLAELVQKIHRAGIYHRDLTYGNMIVQNDEIVLLDVGRSLFIRKVPLILKLEDLSKLDSEGDELKKFLKFYFGKTPLFYSFITLRKKIRKTRFRIKALFR